MVLDTLHIVQQTDDDCGESNREVYDSRWTQWITVVLDELWSNVAVLFVAVVQLVFRGNVFIRSISSGSGEWW